MTPEKKTVPTKIGNFFTSLKLTIFLLIALASTSIIGTIVPQNVSPEKYLTIYSQSTYDVFKALGFLDLYHSWWFLALLVLLSLNLVACSSRRFSATYKMLRRGKTELDENLLKSLSLKVSFDKKNTPEILKDFCLRILKKNFSKPLIHHSAGVHHFFSEKGKYSPLGVYLVHLSILFILLGGILGNFFGYEGYMELAEGEARDGVHLKSSHIFKKLGFLIRCDDFEISYYKDTRQPKDYKSTLTIVDQGKEVLTRTIEVNHPLKYRGIFFYQSNYGTTTRRGKIELLVSRKEGEGQSKKYQAKVGEDIEIEGSNTRIKVIRLVPDFMIDKGKVVSRSNKLVNPAVELAIIKDKVPQYTTWVFQKYPNFHGAGTKEYNIRFLDFIGTQYTGLQVARDPGVGVVWLGCTLLVLGIMITFFLSHRRIWLTIHPKNNKSLIVLAGSSNKNREGFEREFNRLAELIREIDK